MQDIWPDAAVRATLQRETERLLAFGVKAPIAGVGAAWLDDEGEPDLTRPVFTWISSRMVHVYALGHLMGVPGCAELASTAMSGLVGGPLRDTAGGWFPEVRPDGNPERVKECYGHAFVVLAASTAVRAGLSGADRLLAEALAIFDARFWDETAGLAVDSWDADFTALSPYRGLNANMHTVEALLAAADVTGDRVLLERAARICGFAATQAEANRWRLPEHFDDRWAPQLEFNADAKDDQFKPYGATVGHGFEWSRLLLHTEAALGLAALPTDGLDWLEAARRLFERARLDGWAADGADGFVYTTDWDGTPVVRDRFHWVAAEAIAAASVLRVRTGEPEYAEAFTSWWRYAEDHLVDGVHGSWHHQLDEQNRPASTVWPGKPDLYHAVQATLIPRMPLAPSLATALAMR